VTVFGQCIRHSWVDLGHRWNRVLDSNSYPGGELNLDLLIDSSTLDWQFDSWLTVWLLIDSSTLDWHANPYNFKHPCELVCIQLQVESSNVLLKEGGVQLKLTIVDTPGFGDAVDNSNWLASAFVFLIVSCYCLMMLCRKKDDWCHPPSLSWRRNGTRRLQPWRFDLILVNMLVKKLRPWSWGQWTVSPSTSLFILSKAQIVNKSLYSSLA